MNYFVYILSAYEHKRYYKGYTKDLCERLARHNAGKEKSTAPYRPWKLIWFTRKASRSAAVQLELKLKRMSRKKIDAFILRHPLDPPSV
jgi:putative endonuclease